MTENRVAVFDLDGTITRQDTYVDFLLYCLRQKPVRLRTLPALVCYLVVHKAGLRSNHWLKAKYLGAVTGGMVRADLDDLCKQFVRNTLDKNVKQSALDELSRLREEGYILVLATASFGFYVRSLADELRFDEVLCTEAEFDANNKMTGKLDGENCIGVEKARRISALSSQRGWDYIELGYSDSKVDLPMLEMVGRALIVDPKSATEKVAADKGYEVLRWR